MGGDAGLPLLPPAAAGCHSQALHAGVCPPPLAQAVEAQVNLEKLHQEAHAANMRRADVKELYMKVG